MITRHRKVRMKHVRTLVHAASWHCDRLRAAAVRRAHLWCTSSSHYPATVVRKTRLMLRMRLLNPS